MEIFQRCGCYQSKLSGTANLNVIGASPLYIALAEYVERVALGHVGGETDEFSRF